MKKIKRIVLTILTLAMCLTMAMPAMAANHSEKDIIKLYDTEMNFIASFESEEALQDYLANRPSLYRPVGCSDAYPTKEHGSETYETFFASDYDYEEHYVYNIYRVYCRWCDALIGMVSRRA